MKTTLSFIAALLISIPSFAQQTGEVIITELHNRPQKPTDVQAIAAASMQPSYWNPGNSGNANQTDNGEGDEDHTEWFEVYNTTSNPVVMDGWIIQDASSSSRQTIIGNFTLAAGAFAVFTGYNIPEMHGGLQFDYIYDYENPGFNNETSYSDPGDDACPDGVILMKADGTVVDEMRYDYGYGEYINNPESGSCMNNTSAIGFPAQGESSKKSMQLDNNFLNAIDNDNPLYWTFSTNVYETTYNQQGSPGSANEFDATLSSDTFNQNQFVIHPNPVNDVVFINSKDNLAFTNVDVYDAVGKSVIAKTNFDGNQLDTSLLKKGIYFMTITVDKKSVTKKIIKN